MSVTAHSTFQTMVRRRFNPSLLRLLTPGKQAFSSNMDQSSRFAYCVGRILGGHVIDIRDEDGRDAVRLQLNRIISGSVFAHAERLCRFLSYIVEATLDPSRDAVSQFDIALDVFDRDESFDPTVDAIVRVEAGRLRAKLAEYYIDEGVADPILIELPKGAYEANFREKASADQTIGATQYAPAGSWVAASALGLLLLGLAYFFTAERSPSELAGTSQNTSTIAVLPFVNLSDDPGQEYFSDGITEDIITDLSILSGLNVIARTSSFVYKDSPSGIREIGEELGATHILEGSVQRSGGRVRITAQLIDARSESHLWAERYNREIDDIFEIQDEVSSRIVSALQVALVGTEQSRLGLRTTDSIEAYDTFLRAKEQFYQFDESSIAASIELFSTAIERDPDFAEAHAWKARALTYAYLTGFIPSVELSLDPALHHAQTAVEIEPNLPSGHAILAWVHRWQSNFDEALISIDVAIDLDPNFSEALLWRSLILSEAGRGRDALVAIERSNRLNPNYGVTSIFALGRAHFEMGDFDSALAFLDRGIERNPSFLPTHVYRLAVLEQTQDDEAAMLEREVLENLNPDYQESAVYKFYRDHVSDRVGSLAATRSP